MHCSVYLSWLIISCKSTFRFLKGKFVDHYSYVSALRGSAHLESGSCVVGFSTGLLAAAAVALSPDVPALVPLAVEIVLIAFRLGLHIERTARNIEDSSVHEGASWSYVIPEKTEDEAQAALASFHNDRVRRVPFVS